MIYWIFHVQKMSEDSESVEATNDDATLCKMSAVKYGYWWLTTWIDPFMFVDELNSLVN